MKKSSEPPVDTFAVGDREDRLPGYFRAAEIQESFQLGQNFQDICAQIDYLDYLEFKVPVKTFRVVRKLAQHDLFDSPDDETMVAWTGAESVEQIVELRQTEFYERMKEDVWSAALRLRNPIAFREHIEAEKTQDKIFRATLRDAMFNLDPRARVKAQSELIERIAPRAVPGQKTVNVMIGADQAKLLVDTLEELKHLTLEQGSIDGEYSALEQARADAAEKGGGEEPLSVPEVDPDGQGSDD